MSIPPKPGFRDDPQVLLLLKSGKELEHPKSRISAQSLLQISRFYPGSIQIPAKNIPGHPFLGRMGKTFGKLLEVEAARPN